MASVTIKRSWSEIANKLKAALAGVIVGGTASVAGVDQIILWFWNGVLGRAGTSAEMSAAIATIIGSFIGAAIVGYFTPEKVPSGSTTQAPSGVTTSISGDIKTPAAREAGS
jgi:hypothetical protein